MPASMQISPPCVYYPRGLRAHLLKRTNHVSISFLGPDMAPYQDGPTFEMPIAFLERAKRAVEAFNAEFERVAAAELLQAAE